LGFWYRKGHTAALGSSIKPIPMKNLLKKVLSLDLFLPFVKGNRFIFLYHHIRSDAYPWYFDQITTSWPRFVEQIEWIGEHFEIVDIDQIVLPNLSDMENYATIVFDDGFSSVATAADLLLPKKIPFTLFLNQKAIQTDQLWVTNLLLCQSDSEKLRQIGDELFDKNYDFEAFQQDPVSMVLKYADFSAGLPSLYFPQSITEKRLYLTEAQLLDLSQKGVRIGNHSSDHLLLARLSASEQMQQITENKNYLEKITSQSVRHLAIPFGKKEHFSSNLFRAAAENDSPYLYTTQPSRFCIAETDKRPFLLPRIGLTEETPEELAFYVNRTFLKNYHL
jgi:peptidoglycan/xylan/chitin deacetylase (PgdA/CDA1 family)